MATRYIDLVVVTGLSAIIGLGLLAIVAVLWAVWRRRKAWEEFQRKREARWGGEPTYPKPPPPPEPPPARK